MAIVVSHAMVSQRVGWILNVWRNKKKIKKENCIEDEVEAKEMVWLLVARTGVIHHSVVRISRTLSFKQ